jgi:hypothetical protein
LTRQIEDKGQTNEGERASHHMRRPDLSATRISGLAMRSNALLRISAFEVAVAASSGGSRSIAGWFLPGGGGRSGAKAGFTRVKSAINRKIVAEGKPT